MPGTEDSREFPLELIDLDLLDYRWGQGSPNFGAGGTSLISVYNLIIESIQAGTIPKIPPRYGTRWQAIIDMVASLDKLGMEDYLIVWKSKSEKYLVQVGNQRLTAIRVLAFKNPDDIRWHKLKCRISEYWKDDNIIKIKYPYQDPVWESHKLGLDNGRN